MIQTIYNIETERIFPHPQNPRRDLGDLTELAASIKEQGILQNLTLVSWAEANPKATDDEYTLHEEDFAVVIGHRRLAAAKLAGKAEVPCIVAEDMDYKDQIATMLLENMQRADLTPWEQAKGIQMMMDLGETVAGIVDKTGFSESTVRRRVGLLQYDEKKVMEAQTRGARLEDFVKLEEVKDPKTRAKLLESAGTSNFKYEVINAVGEEKRKENIKKAEEVLKTFAKKVDKTDGLYTIRSWYYFANEVDIQKPADADTVKYFYRKTSNGTVEFLREATEEEKRRENSSGQRSDMDIRREKLKAISRQVYELRKDFIKNCPPSKAKKLVREIMESAIRYSLESSYSTDQKATFAELIGIIPDEKGEYIISYDEIKTIFDSTPEKVFLSWLFLRHDSVSQDHYDWCVRYRTNKGLDIIYELLVKLGYQVSDIERALNSGTHELYTKPESKNEADDDDADQDEEDGEEIDENSDMGSDEGDQNNE